jgi:hypothetical protein
MNKYPVTSLNIKFLHPALSPFQMTPSSMGTSIVTRQHGESPRNPASIPGTVKTVIYYQSFHTGFGDHPAFSSVDTEDWSLERTSTGP